MKGLALHTDGLALVVKGARVPVAVPGHLVDNRRHLAVQGAEAFRVFVLVQVVRQLRQIEQDAAELLAAPHALGLAAAVIHVHGVVPVGKTDAGQALGTAVLQGELDRAQHVVPHAVAAAIGVVDLFVQVGQIPGLAQVGAHTQDQPQMIVAEPLWPGRKFRGQARAALAGQGQHLVPGVPVFVLQVPQHAERRPRAIRGVVDRAQGVLRRIARPHAASGAGFVCRNKSRPE